MKVKVIEFDANSPASWFNDHIGEIFEVIKYHDDLIPKRYEVDLTEHRRRGEVTEGRGYLPFSVVEVIETTGRPCMNFAECGNYVTRFATDICPECRENYQGENVQY